MNTLTPDTERMDEVRDDVAKLLAYSDGEAWYTASEVTRAPYRRRADAALAVLEATPSPAAYKALSDKVVELAERLDAVKALAEKWRYKGEFGWGTWQEGHGPDQEGHILDQAAADLRAVLNPDEGKA